MNLFEFYMEMAQKIEPNAFKTASLAWNTLKRRYPENIDEYTVMLRNTTQLDTDEKKQQEAKGGFYIIVPKTDAENLAEDNEYSEVKESATTANSLKDSLASK